MYLCALNAAVVSTIADALAVYYFVSKNTFLLIKKSTSTLKSL